MSGARSAARTIVFPFAWAEDAVARPIGHLFAGMVNYSDVVAQNQRLRYLLGQAQQQASANASAAAQLAQLSAMLNIPVAASLPTIVAQVTTLSPTNFAATVTIGKGQADGIMDGMPVVGNGGLVGRIIATTTHTATVRLITDASSLLGATFGNGATSVLIQGQGVNSPLSASSIPTTATLSVGELLSTDNLQGGLFPAGLPVARVTKVQVNSGATTYSVSLAPVADLSNLAYVDVVLWEPST